ncbi:MAG: hypothetical protein WBI57_08055 [Desulfobacterales bacterium]
MQTSKSANIIFCHIGRLEMNLWKSNSRIRLSNPQRRPSKINAVFADFGVKAGWVLNHNISGIEPPSTECRNPGRKNILKALGYILFWEF